MSDKSTLMKEAQKYLARGQVDKAITEWEKLAKEYPDGNAYNTIGDLYLKKGDKAKAVDSYHKAASFFRQEGFALKALALYKKILNINSADSDALYYLGELNEAKGLTTDAIKYYLASADSLSKEGQKEKILGIYEKILALSPSNIPLRNRVAEIYAREGLTNESSQQYLHIARIYDEKGELEKAIASFQKALDLQPLNREAILDLNGLYEKAGDLNRAVEHIREAVSLFPHDAGMLMRCAETHLPLGRGNEAKEYLRQIIEMEPGNIKARRVLGGIYVKEGDKEMAWREYLPVIDGVLLEENYNDAIDLLESFSSVDPIETGKRLVSLYTQIGEHAKAAKQLISLGDAMTEMDRPEDAVSCFREALKINPDDADLKNKLVELEKGLSSEHVSAAEEKTVQEAITEADIYLRYGLYDNAKNLLTAFVEKEPENMDVHLRLKSLYVDSGDAENAVSECLILSDLYKDAGNDAASEQMIKEALGTNPDDPRLAGMAVAQEAGVTEAFSGPVLEDYTEELAEADFYSKQGLIDEARSILERLHDLFPDNEDISQKLLSLGRVMEGTGVEGIQHMEDLQRVEDLRGYAAEVEPPVETEAAEGLTLGSDVMEIFDEFKKGLEKELEEEDYETHYNLGIAYKEMGLTDDAIREFQSSRKDPERFLPSSTMLGACYMEKGLYALAIEVLKGALESMQEKNEAYWAMKYDLAEAYEKNGGLKEALDLYIQVYGWNSKFREVSDKMNQLRASIPESPEQKKPKGRKDRVSYL